MLLINVLKLGVIHIGELIKGKKAWEYRMSI